MKVANILPTSYMSLTIGRDYNMLLTHLTEDPTYVDNALKLRGYKILDNSAYELGESLNTKTLIKAAKAVKADEVILPDVLKDGKRTLIRTMDSIEEIAAALSGVKLMAVPQGKDIEEWLECYTELIKLPIHVIGINKFTHDYMLGGRLKFCKSLKECGLVLPNLEYHLLGLPEDISEIRNQAKYNEWIRGVDTCVVYLITKTGRKIKYLDSLMRPNVNMHFDDTRDAEVEKLLSFNIKMVDKWVGSKVFGHVDY